MHLTSLINFSIEDLSPSKLEGSPSIESASSRVKTLNPTVLTKA